jgi:hypothetical protein
MKYTYENAVKELNKMLQSDEISASEFYDHFFIVTEIEFSQVNTQYA